VIQLRGKSATGKAQASLVKCRLLPDLFARYEPGEAITVLDLGPGTAYTTEFLKQFKSRIHFLDLLDAPADWRPVSLQEDQSEKIDRVALWRDILALPENTQVDVCLFWDYLHFLDLEDLDAFGTALQPHVARHATGYGFGSLYSEKLESHVYSLKDESTISVAAADYPTPKFCHSQQVLSERLHCFKIGRGTLLQAGRLELLFEAY
jgi:hypothetical protein